MTNPNILYLSKAEPFEPPSKLMSPTENINLYHKTVYSFFPNMGRRVFLYRVFPKDIRILSSSQPRDDRGEWKIRTIDVLKLSDILKGQNYAYDVLVNATEYKGDKVKDIVSVAQYELKHSDLPREEWPTCDEIIQKAAAEWLKKRQEKYGFENLKSEAHQLRTRFIRKKNGKEDIVPYEVLSIRGYLTVKNERKFRATLVNGIGRQKGYGCGCLLIKKLS